MNIVTVSSKFQIVIPREIRENLHIKPGQKLHLIEIGDQVRLVPEQPVERLRGLLKGCVNDFDRGADGEERG